MKLPLLRQLAQLMLGLGLGAVLGLAFDVLRVPRRHARSAVFRALLDGAFDALDYTEETASGGGFWSRLFGG